MIRQQKMIKMTFDMFVQDGDSLKLKVSRTSKFVNCNSLSMTRVHTATKQIFKD